jgi:hypothetical protein
MWYPCLGSVPEAWYKQGLGDERKLASLGIQ